MSIESETRVVLSNVSWATFEALLEETESRLARFTYDQGQLEITSPSPRHERIHRLLGRVIEAITEEMEIPVRSGGAMSLKDRMKEKGLEPDECYYLASEPQVRGRDDLDLDVDPPPDLAIEVQIARSRLDKLAIYAALGVSEVWLFQAAALRVYQLSPDGTYTLQPRSRALPFLSLEKIEEFLARRNETDETTWIRSFRNWVRTLKGQKAE